MARVRRIREHRRGPVAVAVVAVAAGVLAACGAPPAGSVSLRSGGSVAGHRPPGSFYSVPAPLVPAPPGTLIRSGPVDTGGLRGGATAYRMIYHSESAGGSDVAVSGLVVVPGGRPPTGGFPIASWAHGTTGLADQCAPSLDGPDSIPYLAPLLAHRMIVVATDYQGLGTPGVSPYLVGQSEGQNLLDAARAARTLVGPAASDAVVVIGYSQGGQAALFAGQIAPSYAPELFVAGVVAIGPEASIFELAPTRPGHATDPDAAFAAMALSSWATTYGNLALSSVLTRSGLARAPVVASGCADAVAAAYDTLPASALFRPGWSADPAVRADDAANRPGQAPILAPVLVVQGTSDNLIPVRSTTRLVEDSLCRDQHDSVDYVTLGGASHTGALARAVSPVVSWVSARLAGTPDTRGCTGAARS